MALRKLYSTRKVVFNYFKNPESTRNFSVTSCNLEEVKVARTRFDVKPQWDRALTEGEKCIGPQKSFVSLRYLMNDEVTNWGAHMERLEGSNHPMYDAAK